MEKLLFSVAAIRRELVSLGERTKRLDIATLGGATGDFSVQFLRNRPFDCRVVIGEHSRGLNFAHAVGPKVRIRYLKDNHCKLFIFYLPKPIAVLGSMNLGNGMEHECAISFGGQAAKDCALHFSTLWNQATPIEATGLQNAVSNLASRSFDNPEVNPLK